VIRCRGLRSTYREGELVTPVFEGIDLDVRRGETVAIVGASGAGKSTLLHLLGGLDSATAGEVMVEGQQMSALAEKPRGQLRNRAHGFVYQFHHCLPEFTSLVNVMMPLMIRGECQRRHARRRRPCSSAWPGPSPGPQARRYCPEANAQRAAVARCAGHAPGLRAGRRTHRQPWTRRPRRACSTCCSSSTARSARAGVGHA
jgi:ABC-type lipoprotein export system ATPase subunit